MGVGELEVTLELRQQKKALVWLYIRLMVLLARLGVLAPAEAMRRAGQMLAGSFCYRVNNGVWQMVDGKVEVA